MAADAPPTHEYFSANGQQGLYPQQQDFSRLGQFNPQQQQQQQQQQRWAAAQQQMRANQYAAMKQKQMAAALQMRQPQGQYPHQQFPNYASPAFNQQQQAFNFAANPTPPRDPGFPNAQRDFSTPQREFSAGTPQRDFSGTPVNGPPREFSATPAPIPTREFSQSSMGTPGSGHMQMGTPAPGQRELPTGTPAPQPHAFLPNRGMSGTPSMGQMNMHPTSRTGTPIVRPGTAMSGGGSFSDHRTSQPPQTPKMGMAMGGLPNGMNMGMNMGAMNMQNNINMGNAMGLSGPNPMGGANTMGMPGANMTMQSNNGMGLSNAANTMGIGANMPGNNMGMPANTMMSNPMGMPAGNMGMPGANNLGMTMPNMMPANGLTMTGNNLTMGANNLGMPGAGGMSLPSAGINVAAGGNTMGMPSVGNMNAGGMATPMAPMAIPPPNITIPGAPNLAGTNISPTKPMGLGINVGAGAPNALGMGGMGMNGMGIIGLGGTPTRPTPANPSAIATSPTKLGRRVVSGSPMPSSPTKPATTPTLPAPPGTNPQTTLVTALPLLKDENDVTHGGALPPVSDDEMKQIQGWMARDAAFQKVYTHVGEHRAEEESMLRNAKYAWWEMDDHAIPGMAGKFQIWWPADQRKMKDRKMKLLGRRDLDVSKIARSGSMITQLELLVPIRLEIDHDHFRLRDTFTWNLNDPVITPEVFAQCLCDDYQISSNSVVQAVAKSITEQLQEHRAHILETGPSREEIRGEISEKDQEWWAKWRRREQGVDEDEEAEGEDKDGNEELRVLVKVDVIVGTMNLTDQFEWDINDPHNSPEEFAEVYCNELGLGGEFKTAVAHAIREQVSVYQKSLFLVGHPFDGTPIADDELRTAMLPPIDHSFRFDRTLLEQFTPQLNVLQEAEIERNERERERELKRKRRQTRGRRGIVLPDRDLQKTHRTAIGYAEIEPSPAQQAAQQQAPVTFRRAAAAAASLTIANLAATENGTSPVQTPMHIPEKQPVLMQQQQQQPPPPLPPKQKRQRTGVLQPPPLPKHVFLSRSADPAPSTGLDSDAAAQARADFGDAAPEGPASPTGEEDGQQAMLKRVLEKEGAESAEGLHPNMIDGTWHCSNCGCPESISVGRRKGPLGQGTMCGECGKFWHKHRKPRPVEYNTSIEYHLNLKKLAKLKKRGGKANVNVNPSPSKPPSGTPAVNGRDSLSPSPPPQKPLDPGSPDSTIGPDSPKADPPSLSLPPPVEEQKPTPSPAPAPSEEPSQSAPEANGTPPPAASPQSQVSTQTRDGVPMPGWILDCLAATQRRYVNDRIDVIAKPRANENEAPAFRLKCLDCPGKLYTPGPDQTLSNFEVHLKNRGHRSNVNKRVITEAAAAGQPIPDLRRITPQATPTPTPAQTPASEPAQSN
ncbi:SNF5/SMARCB 1/INI1 family protein [Rhizoctonia solani AG-3 Rhs1AP]|uniref:SNF5/SMARCB 1/INI1 family protein n=1 Tax=Rhizoctonia solani AG-3 Rhs1AP TaxID=1086054 RepID=X8JED3_9AGAM|nr:SNF5/SMARCB 1/INI1 family protein [Rhizoctonia solani AG-3 Rhs1AP]